MSKVAYKGFNRDLTCRNFQYEVGKTYTHTGDVIICSSGFHACEHPLDVFSYYSPAYSRFAIVELSGRTTGKDNDTKIAAAQITISAEMQIPDMVQAAVDYVFSRTKRFKKGLAVNDRGAASSTGSRSAASSTGDSGAASSTGDYSAASSTGFYGAASSTGDYSAASSTGFCGAASSTGDYSAASSTGFCGAASSTGNSGAASSTGDYSAASSTGSRSAASSTGDYSAASSTGDYSAASSTGFCGAASSTGFCGAASSTGFCGAAMASGFDGRVMGADGCALFLVERDGSDGRILSVWAGVVGENNIKPNVFYKLVDGQPVEL